MVLRTIFLCSIVASSTYPMSFPPAMPELNKQGHQDVTRHFRQLSRVSTQREFSNQLKNNSMATMIATINEQIKNSSVPMFSNSAKFVATLLWHDIWKEPALQKTARSARRPSRQGGCSWPTMRRVAIEELFRQTHHCCAITWLPAYFMKHPDSKEQLLFIQKNARVSKQNKPYLLGYFIALACIEQFIDDNQHVPYLVWNGSLFDEEAYSSDEEDASLSSSDEDVLFIGSSDEEGEKTETPIPSPEKISTRTRPTPLQQKDKRSATPLPPARLTDAPRTPRRARPTKNMLQLQQWTHVFR